MSGHSHWANIEHKKGRKDRERGKVFSKLARQITQAVRVGCSSDPEFNPCLRSAVEEARGVNMPKDNIERAIRRGGGDGTFGFEKQVLEGYGSSGVAFLICTQTDNKNRTLSEVRKLFENSGGSLGEAGCSAYIFEGGNSKFTVGVEGELGKRVQNMIKVLRDHPDVVDVFCNAEIS